MASLLRVRSPSGMVKVAVDPAESVEDLYAKAASELGVHPHQLKLSTRPQGPPLPRSAAHAIGTVPLRHGDLLHADAHEGKWADAVASGPGAATAAANGAAQLQEDPVDQELDKMSGLIARTSEREGMRRISELPLEPYDAGYLKEKGIKHMSFHAFLRKQQNKQRSSGVTGAALQLVQDEVEDLARKTLKKDTTMLKLTDMPSAVVLRSQEFRIVDHVEFETSQIVDRFLHGWRLTGTQRFGYMYGRYEPHPDLPLGIKAVVAFIYEPPQLGHPDGLELADEDQDRALVDGIAQVLGLRKVGMIFTDLIDDQSGTGRVMVKRHANSYFLSSLEVLFSANQQLDNPNPCKYSNTGRFGSKFVTVVVSGDPAITEGVNIGVAAYQVSNQAMAMTRADMMQATVDPALMRVVKDDSRVIPEVLYRFQNEYGTDVTQPAKPSFPVEYLLVNVTNGFPKEPKPTFLNAQPFPVENRPTEAVTLEQLYRFIQQAGGSLGAALSDFHVLLAIAKTGVVNLERDFALLCDAIRARDVQRLAAATQTDSWRTLLAIGQAQSTPTPAASTASRGAVPPARARFAQELGQLLEMGFENEARNLELLAEYNGSIEAVLQRLM